MAAIPTTFGHGGQGLGDAAGSPNIAGVCRDIATDLAVLRTAYVNLLTKLDADLSLEEILELINNIKAQYEAHRATAGTVHQNADAGNAITAADAIDLATGYTLANDIKAQLNAHLIDASELEEAITLLNEIKVDYEAHRVYDVGSCHNGNPDSTNVVTAADASDLATAYTLANDLKAMYEAHRVLAATHTNPDATNTISSADATTFTTLKALANELRTDYEAHRVLIAGPVHGGADAANVVSAVAVGTAGIHEQDDVTNTVTSADATTQATLNTLSNELRTDYEAHRVLTTAHEAADTTNVVTEPEASTDYEAALTPAVLLTTSA